ncbi:MAG: DUF1990 family protein [Chloroflexota bacterium]|nr:DUF1990 family protein [Chloroflexota bacterium]
MPDLTVDEQFARMESPWGVDEYNFEHFGPQHVLFEARQVLTSGGLKPGQLAPDWELPSVEGGTIRLSDLRGKPVLLHFGSFTSPVAIAAVEPLRELYEEWGDKMHFLDILVRQAHPGPQVPPYRSFEQKMRDGKRYKEREDIPWPVLVDDLAGTTHQVYGGLSDPTYIIDSEGRVAFYNMITSAPALHQALTALFAQGSTGIVRGGVDRLPHLAAALTDGWPALVRGLPQSLLDLMVAAPGSPILVWLGWKLRPLLAPLTRRARPLPLVVRVAFVLLGLLLLWPVVRWLRIRYKMPIREWTTSQPIDDEQPKSVPEEALNGTLPAQMIGDGTGPVIHRRYRADIANPQVAPKVLMERMQCQPNDFCPVEMARFVKIKGEEEYMHVGNEYEIRVPGPLYAPVRVIDVDPTSFSLLTLDGHFEAGEIRFRLMPHPTRADALRFEILSWARSHDDLIEFTYQKLWFLKEAQTSMWVYFCERVVEESGGELIGEIEVVTETHPYEDEVIPSE